MRTAIPLLLTCLLASPFAGAEIYKWVDENGRMHFSDSPPGEGRQAEEVKIKTQSVDMEGARRSSDRFTQPKSNVRSEREQQRQAQAQAQKNRACQQLWNRILKVSGPVRFLDEDGKEVRVSEQERKEREARLRKEYKERCRN